MQKNELSFLTGKNIHLKGQCHEVVVDIKALE
jgi:hypothetical protein